MPIIFSWNGPGTPITNVNVGQVVFQINCTNAARESSVTNLEWDNQEAHCTDIQFAPTGDSDIDDVISDRNFLEQVKNEINQQVGFSKRSEFRFLISNFVLPWSTQPGANT
ncbi:hypothetical protein HC766_06805 [Candidatus Gracilibacteria bacterium]|nr:hypothetical protein [Candidatus Gracilibacteria bacterium]